MKANAWLTCLSLIAAFVLAGCASVPMAPAEQDAASKTFAAPPANMAGIYIYRSSFVGQSLKKNVLLDGTMIGETANKVFLHRVISPGGHTLATESEFSDNDLAFTVEAGKNYFFRQYIRMGVFVGGANVKAVSEEEGMKYVLECGEAVGVTGISASAKKDQTPQT